MNTNTIMAPASQRLARPPTIARLRLRAGFIICPAIQCRG